MQVEISTRLTAPEVQQAVLTLYEMATGLRDPNVAARALLVRIGLATLGEIKQAFVLKARGGTDSSGLSWPKLSKKTIAYSRRHPGVPKPYERALYAPSWQLTEEQRERWWALYRQYGGTGGAGSLFHTQPHNPYAARLAWRILKIEGAKTMLQVYGHVQVEILRDTGLLLNTLSPGFVDPAGASVPAFGLPANHEQVFRVERAAVLLGTNRKHAKVHHEGLGHVPQRRLWPEPRTWPAQWWDSILHVAQQGVVDILIKLLRSHS